MRILFVKPALVLPRTSGHDIYCYYMMKGLAELGAEVGLVTKSLPSRRRWKAFASRFVERSTISPPHNPGSLAAGRFRSYWGERWTDQLGGRIHRLIRR
jgi:hypothetical protein